MNIIRKFFGLSAKVEVSEQKLLVMINKEKGHYRQTPLPSDTFDLLCFGLAHRDPTVRAKCCDLLSWVETGESEAAQQIVPLLRDKDSFVRQRACAIISFFADREIRPLDAISHTVALLADQDAETRRLAICSLINLRAYDTLPAIENLLNDPDRSVRNAAEEALPWLTREPKESPHARDFSKKVKKCLICGERFVDGVLECSKCGSGRFIWENQTMASQSAIFSIKPKGDENEIKRKIKPREGWAEAVKKIAEHAGSIAYPDHKVVVSMIGIEPPKSVERNWEGADVFVC